MSRHTPPRSNLALILALLGCSVLCSFALGIVYSRSDQLGELYIAEPEQARGGAASSGMMESLSSVQARDSFTLKQIDALDIWQRRARTKLRDLLGISDFTRRQPLLADSRKISEAHGLVVSEIVLEMTDRTRLRCYLFTHDDNTSRPAILIPPGHGAGIEQTAGVMDSYQNGNARKLAEAGYVTLSCNNRGMGTPLTTVEHRKLAYNSLVLGRSYLGLVLEDLQQQVSFLLARKDVDRQFVGVAGVSIGGEAAHYLLAVDERVSAGVVMGYYGNTSLNSLYPPTNSRDFKRHLCHLVPGLIQHFRTRDITIMAAPRPLLIARGDLESPPRGNIAEDVALIEAVYAHSGHSDEFTYTTHAGKHVFDNPLALQFFAAVWRPE